MKEQKKKSIVTGVMLLSVSGIIVKIMGLLYKIPLANLLGNEGMGYFTGAYTIYLLFYTIATAGLPIALSILVARARVTGGATLVARIDKITSAIFAVVGLTSFAVLGFGSAFFANAVGNPKSVYAVAAISPSILFVCIMGAVRGYFQGHKIMLPTAVSQITEAAGKLLIGVFLANYALKRGYPSEKVAAFAILGITIGSAFSMVLLLLMKFRYCRRENKTALLLRKENGEFALPSVRTLTGEIIRIAIPVTLSSAVVSLSGVIDLATVMHRLSDIGYTTEIANALYGNYSALAVALVNMPIVLIVPISTGLIPYVSEARANNDRARIIKTMDNALNTTTLIAMPAAFGLAVLSKPVLLVLFEDSAALSAAPLLSLLAPSLVFIALANVTGSLLQAVDGVGVPVLSMTVGSAVKIAVSYFAIGKWGIYGTPMGTFACYASICIINFAFLASKTNHAPGFFRVFVKPFAASVMCALSAAYVYRLAVCRIGNMMSVFLSIFAAGCVYAALIVLFGCLRDMDFDFLWKRKKQA